MAPALLCRDVCCAAELCLAVAWKLRSAHFRAVLFVVLHQSRRVPRCLRASPLVVSCACGRGVIAGLAPAVLVLTPACRFHAWPVLLRARPVGASAGAAHVALPLARFPRRAVSFPVSPLLASSAHALPYRLL